MKSKRREFLRAGATVAGAMTAYATAGAMGKELVQSGLSVMLQFSGLTMHGRWRRNDPTKPFPGWEVLMVNDGRHDPELRIPLANVKSPSGHVEDRLSPGLGVWDLENVDLRIKLDASNDREVTAIENKRPIVGGKPAECPDPKYPDQFQDISWMADFARIYDDGMLDPRFKLDDPAQLPRDLISARVRLPKGTIACARPSLETYEKMMFSYSDRPTYPPQFTTDLVRFTAVATSTIKLDLVPMAGGVTKTLELQSPGATPIFVSIDNHDPNLAKRALAGEIDNHTYWHHHFLPYHDLLQKKPRSWQLPVVSCCGNAAACDPPFYCIPPVGNL